MKKIATVLLVLAVIFSMAPALGAEAGSSAWAANNLGPFGLNVAETDSWSSTYNTYSDASSMAIGTDGASVSSIAGAQDISDESSIAATSGEGDVGSMSSAGGDAYNYMTGYAETSASSLGIGDASTSAGTLNYYSWYPSPDATLVVESSSAAGAQGLWTSAETDGYAETYWYWFGDTVQSSSDSYANGDFVITSADGDAGISWVSSHADSQAVGPGAYSFVTSTASSTWWSPWWW